MFTKRFAQELMQLGRIDLSPEASLERITALAAREVAGCAGAGALVWLGDQVIQSAVSHPDLGVLLEYQYTEHDGPQWEARQTGDLVVMADTAATDRWPGYAAVALRHGVRSSLALPLPAGTTVVTVGLYAVRAGVFSESAESMAVLLTEQIAVAAGNTERYEAAAREASQMRKALDSWGVIGEAKGILMQAHGCDADTAFDKLRRISQRTQLKLADVARRLIEEYSGPGAVPRPEHDLSPG